MANNYMNILWAKTSRGTYLGRNSIIFFGLFLFLLFSSLSVVGQSTDTPSFQHIDAQDRGNASIGTEANITLAVDTDSQGNVYLLTFGNGVYKYDPVSEAFSIIITDELGAAGNLNSPLDLAIDNNDVIYIADGDSKLIKKFTTNGIPVGVIGSGFGGNGKNEFWEPTGIEFDNDNNLFVVDAYRGTDTEVTEKYFLKIYYNNGSFRSFQGTSGHPINNPYRVAANDNHILISHSENNGEVLVFNKDLSFNKVLTDIGSPGSLFIDEFDFIYAVDYAQRLNFSQIFKLIKGTLPLFPEGFNLYNNIEAGIAKSEFKIQIYDSNLNSVGSIDEPENPPSGQDHLQLPIDLTLDKCSKLYLDDANIAAFVTLNFDLEIYNRTPSFDTENPVIISCVPEQTASLTNGEFILPDYSSLAVFSATDNCDKNLTLTQDPPKDTPITGTTTVTITAKDDAGNSSFCEFQVIIETSTDTEPPTITCPAPISKNVDPGECGAIITFADATATDNSGDTPTITRVDNTGLNSEDLFPVGLTTITFRATDAAGNFKECSFTITITDNEDPTISCTANISETVAFGETGKIITYTAPTFDDNCSGSTITQTAGLASGSEFSVTTTTNTFVVTDASGNTATCSFDVTITESSDTEKPVITCPAPISKNVDPGECGAVITFADATATDNSGVAPTISRVDNTGLNSGDLFPVGQTTISFRATDGSGNFNECSFTITVTDNEKPTITCPDSISDTVAIGETGKIVTYTAPTFDDNCSGSTITQTAGLPSESEFPLGTTINTFVVTDASGNTATCTFNVILTEENTPNTAPIAKDDTYSIDQDTSLSLGTPGVLGNDTDDDADTLTATIQDLPSHGSVVLSSDGSFTYTPDSGYFGEDIFTYVANDGSENSNLATVFITVKDTSLLNSAPMASDNNYSTDLEVVLQVSVPGVLGNDTDADDDNLMAVIQREPVNGIVVLNSDGSFTYTPNPFFTGEDDFTYVANDGSEDSNVALVTITVNPRTNTAPISRDDIYSTLQEVTLTVPASSGVLSNDSDGEGDALTAVLITDVSSGTLTLNPDGSFIYVPNSGFSGNDFFTYSANDGSQNSVVSTATIEVVRVSGNTVTCKESVTLELDENGTASLIAQDLFTTRPADLESSISQEVFTCEDLGENTITLSYSNSDIQGSCEVIIIVKDVSAPIVRVKDISVALNQFGSVSITPEMVDNGSTDNCGNLSFSLSKLNFGCKELGENTVTFTATDSSGNTSSMTAIVTVTGSCEIQPSPEVEYIFIYPNPTTGPFQFATPSGVTIQRVEAFDARGRMIMYKEFSAADLQYAMDLSGVQNAVYILKLFSSEGTSIVRVIIN